MTQTTPEQRQELLRLAEGAHRATTAGRTVQDMADSIHFQEASLNAVTALLSDLDAAEAELLRLRTALAEAERDAEINRNAYRDLKSQHSELRNAVGRGKGCCCQMCLPDIADEVEVWKRKAARWDECERIATPCYAEPDDEEQNWVLYVLAPAEVNGLSFNFAAAIDAAIEAREQETT